MQCFKELKAMHGHLLQISQLLNHVLMNEYKKKNIPAQISGPFCPVYGTKADRKGSFVICTP